MDRNQNKVAPGICTEPELTELIDECTADGNLNRAAVGWSRHPLHRCNLSGHYLRQKLWNYWCVTTEDYLLSLTLTDLGVIGLAVASYFEFSSGRTLEKQIVLPFALGLRLPEHVVGTSLRFHQFGLHLDMLEESAGTRLVVAYTAKGVAVSANILVHRPSGHETMNVVIPWSDELFQFTSKQTALPATGSIRIGTTEHKLGPHNQAFGCLDFGRGVWPYRTTWNWAAASGDQYGRRIGITLGGKWTDGTGMTENGLCVDGRLHKLSEELIWEYDRTDWMRPWRISTPVSKRVDLTATPFYEKRSDVNLGIFASEIHVVFSRFTGTIETEDGERIDVTDMVGWAEEHIARW